MDMIEISNDLASVISKLRELDKEQHTRERAVALERLDEAMMWIEKDISTNQAHQ